jgi:predicted  nucleic acid-binding Zn-ribbon protein
MTRLDKLFHTIFLKISLTMLTLYKEFAMSGQGYEELKILNKKLDELFNNYNNLKSEYVDLKTGNEALKNQLNDRDARIKELEIKYERIKLAGALLGEGESGIEARKKITELVREIDSCVALLNR